MRGKLSILASAACALLLAIPATASNVSAAKTNKKTTQKVTTTAAMRSAWPPETLSGKIAMVDPAKKLMVVETPNGVPFDMVVTSKTRIKSGEQSLTLKDLARDKTQTVSVKYVPDRRGDIARSIRIGA